MQSRPSIAAHLAGGVCLILFGGLHAWAATGRVAIGGTWGTGYAGLFARHGMPRERLLDPQLADPAVLSRYDLVIVSGTVSNWSQAQQAVEAYVREGGSALLECTALPSEEMLPGLRVAPQTGPNFVIGPSDHPAVAGLAPGREFPAAGEPAAAIVPAPGCGAVVLATFTENGVPDQVRGKFVLNGQSVPAIVHLSPGPGHVVYCGPWLGDALAFGRDHSDLVFALVRFLTGDNVVPRMALAGPESRLTLRGTAAADTAPSEPLAASLPEGYERLEAPGPQFAEYNLTGVAQGPVDLLLDYVQADRCYALHLQDGAPVEYTGPAKTLPASVGPSPQIPAGTELMVARRRGSVAVYAAGRRIFQAADAGQWAGAIGCRGLGDPAVQPVEPVRFRDDFMQEAGAAVGWHAVTGNWQILSTEGAPQTGANPFSYGTETTDPALSVVGDWFWDDYRAEASVRWTAGGAGLVVHYRDADRYDLLEADLTRQVVRLVTVRNGQAAEKAAFPAALRPWQWYRLALATSRDLAVVWLDGKALGECRLDGDDWGPVGLYARGAKAAFDDVQVTPWRVGPGLNEPAAWRSESTDPWVPAGAAGTGRGTLFAGDWFGDVAVRVKVRLGDAERAGVRVRDTGAEHCAALVERAGGGLALKLLHVRNGVPTVLGTAPLGQLKAADTLLLTAKAVRDRVFCVVEGGPYLVRCAPLPPEGAVGLSASGKGAASFSSSDIRPADTGLHPTDPPTPAYAGAVDIMTWAGPAFAWVPDPSDLECFWHEWACPGPLRLRVGVHRGEAAEVAAELRLAGADGADTDGYCARFTHTWDAGSVRVSLARAGKPLGEGTFAGPIDAAGFVAELESSGPTVALRLEGQTVLTCHEPKGAPELQRVGVRLEGARLHGDDILLERQNVRTYTFSEAPTDWLVQRGAWEVTSRWTCSPGWTWLSGLSPTHAMVQSKWQVEGDVLLDTYVGAKMMNTPAGRKETLQDLRLGLCGKPGFLNAGYCFLIGAKGGGWTALQRNGLVVAETTGFVVPQGSVHNDWVQFTAAKRGADVALLCRGQPVLSYTDPAPLADGTVSVGAYDNGVMVPRVTVCGSIR